MNTLGALKTTSNVDDEENVVEDEVEDDEVEDDDDDGKDIEVQDEVADECVDKDEVQVIKSQQESRDIGKDGEDLRQIGIQDSGPPLVQRKQKGVEVFVGGIAKDALDDDLRAVFEKVGKVMDIRTSRDFKTGKNRGYTFVRYAEPSHAQRAVSELHGKEILGTPCRVSLSDENDSLYLGNINKDWSKENLMDALKKYAIDNLENVALLEDPLHEGMNRGYGFLEFTTHKDALRALNRLKQQDVIFGGVRSAKVAWAQLLGEPDEETMAKVKIVYVDGLPPAWDEEQVKSYFGKYGQIEQTILGRDKASRKRKDYGFIYFATREGALACIEALDDTEVGEGEQKAKLKVRLSKPVFKSRNGKKGEIHGNHPIGKNADARSRRSGQDGRGQTITRSLASTSEKLVFSNNHHDLFKVNRPDLTRGLSVGGRNVLYTNGIFSSPLLHGDVPSRHRTSKFSSSQASNDFVQNQELDQRGSHRERDRFESSIHGFLDASHEVHSDRRAESQKFTSENYHNDHRDAIHGRKRGFSDLESDPRHSDLLLSASSRARLAHLHDLPLGVGGSQYAQAPYFKGPARAPVGHASQYDAGQSVALSTTPVHGYSIHDPLSRPTGNSSFVSGTYPYGSAYSHGAEVTRDTSYVASTYEVPHGASRFSGSRVNSGPYY